MVMTFFHMGKYIDLGQKTPGCASARVAEEEEGREMCKMLEAEVVSCGVSPRAIPLGKAQNSADLDLCCAWSGSSHLCPSENSWVAIHKYHNMVFIYCTEVMGCPQECHTPIKQLIGVCY